MSNTCRLCGAKRVNVPFTRLWHSTIMLINQQIKFDQLNNQMWRLPGLRLMRGSHGPWVMESHGKSWTLAHGWEKSHGPWVMDVLGSVSFSVVHLMLLRQDLLVVRTGKKYVFLNQLFFKNNGWITCSGRTSRRQRSLGSPAVCNSWWTDSPQPETQEINLSLLQKLYSWLQTWSTSVDFISPFPLSFVSSRQPMLLFGRRWRCLGVRFFWIFFSNSNYDCMTKLSILVCVVLRRILEWLELMGLNLDGHH